MTSRHEILNLYDWKCQYISYSMISQYGVDPHVVNCTQNNSVCWDWALGIDSPFHELYQYLFSKRYMTSLA